MRHSRGATAGTLHSMVNSVPAATEVGDSVSSTCFGGSAAKRREVRSGWVCSSGRSHPAQTIPCDHRVLRKWAGDGRRKQFRVKDVLGGSFRDMMTAAMDTNGGALVSKKKRFRICSVN